jgi:hypothetical protein
MRSKRLRVVWRKRQTIVDPMTAKGYAAQFNEGSVQCPEKPVYVQELHIWNAGNTIIEGNDIAVSRILCDDATRFVFCSLQQTTQRYVEAAAQLDGNTAKLSFGRIAPGAGAKFLFGVVGNELKHEISMIDGKVLSKEGRSLIDVLIPLALFLIFMLNIFIPVLSKAHNFVGLVVGMSAIIGGILGMFGLAVALIFADRLLRKRARGRSFSPF